jgi:DNA-binding MarR family transcriptional regulator
METSGGRDRLPSREEDVSAIAALLPHRSAQFGRMLWRLSRGSLPRGMASVLGALGDGAQTIGQLTEREGVAQPTMTRMVDRLAADGLVRRSRSADDGRVVVVELTREGAEQLAMHRARYLAVLDERLTSLSDDQLRALREASDALEMLVDVLRRPVETREDAESHM